MHSLGDTEPAPSSLRTAVIGVGAFGVEHIRAHMALGAEVVAIADTDADRAQAVAQRHGVPRWYTDPARLLEECGPDAISIATHPAHHVPLGLMALERGCFVLVEKPLALNLESLCPLLAHPARARVLPGHTLRYSAAHRDLCRRVHDGEFGRLFAIAARRDRPKWHTMHYPDIHLASMTSIHDVDLAIWISGKVPTQVSALAVGSGPAGMPQAITAMMRTPDGAAWHLEASWLLPNAKARDDRFAVYTEAGVAALTVHESETSLTLPSGEVLHYPADPDPLHAEVAELFRCVADGVPSNVVTVDEAAAGVTITAAMIRSSNAAGAAVGVQA